MVTIWGHLPLRGRAEKLETRGEVSSFLVMMTPCTTTRRLLAAHHYPRFYSGCQSWLWVFSSPVWSLTQCDRLP
jgi:hypothetical protein